MTRFHFDFWLTAHDWGRHWLRFYGGFMGYLGPFHIHVRWRRPKYRGRLVEAGSGRKEAGVKSLLAGEQEIAKEIA